MNSNLIVIPVGIILAIIVLYLIVVKILGLRVISNDKYAVVERWWSTKGSLKNQIIALNGEAGFLPEVVRGGFHIITGLMFKVHVYPLITIPQGQIGYVFSRSGEVLKPGQVMGRTVPESNNFQDVRLFLENGGQQGVQRQILREGTYSINLAIFSVITKSDIYYLPVGNSSELQDLKQTQATIQQREGFDNVVIRTMEREGEEFDIIGVVTVHDAPSLPEGEVIAPVVGGSSVEENSAYHNNFQDPEAFLVGGGKKGVQLQTLVEGTYVINRLFATIEFYEKTVIPVGFVGVVNSFTGSFGADTSGNDYKHGQLVPKGCKGVWEEALPPGKYAINPHAMKIELVPTTNIILKWENGISGDHKLDNNLREVDLITKDAFQPSLPLSVVLHVDYRKAPWVIQKFGNMQKLVNGSIDQMVSSWFKNEGQTRTLIELIQDRSAIQEKSTIDMKKKFEAYNLELEEVLIGSPKPSSEDGHMVEVLNQLRDRQLAIEKQKTYVTEQKTAETEKALKEAQAIAQQQSALTKSNINIEIEYNKGQAQSKKAEQEAIQITTLAKANAERERLTGEAQAYVIEQKGRAEGLAIKAQVDAYGGPEFQLQEKIATRFAEAIENSKVAIVPNTVVSMGGEAGTSNFFETLMKMNVAKELGVDFKSKDKTVETAEEIA